ncbi:patatin-like phospholipase family protein [Asticcacaulis endophyticus]|uniref:Cyclic nucleotide-binding protein n=1 Tax=Asticcacaulis endophyticus TaxID=1395890 RepID=A0A918UYF8_9CAUL|nr:patatin-like phospholipase family protein [Asticcacaulis endophyticus]GGZ43069.1 cyclic nucleotide-binding protein [Asticcacaulis endophyticus]
MSKKKTPAHGPDNAPNPLPSLEDALAKLFATTALEAASWITLTGGSRLFSAGDDSDHLYLVRTGRLGVFRQNEDDGELNLIGVIKPGEPAGEMSLIAGTEHTSTVIALRDTDLLALPRDAFFEAASKSPEVMLALAQKMILRAREVQTRGSQQLHNPNVFAFFAVCDRPALAYVETIAEAVRAMGYTVCVLDSGFHGSTSEEFSTLEAAHDYVLYVAEKPEANWRQLAARQVDHSFLIVPGLSHVEAPDLSAVGADLGLSLSAGLQHPPDLIIQHDQATRTKGIRHTKLWLDALKPARWFHVCDRSQADTARIARIVTGHSTGLVLSGGGARAFAHLGAVWALRDAHVPIDFVGGSSMGAILAATAGLEWSQEEMDRRIRAAFVDSSPLDDISFPFIALTAGKKVDARLEEHFGEVLIEDMPIPFFCLSSNLTSGTIKLHKTGSLRKALRASISLPGIMPPVIEDGQVLVDGAVMRSFPARLMANTHLGTVIGVDVTRAKGIDPRNIKVPKSLPTWFGRGDWRKGPPIVSIMMRSATITSAADLAQSRAATDLLIIPEPGGVEIRDWKAYDLAVESGYQTTVDTLSKLDGPVTSMRKRGLSVHPDIPAFTPDDDHLIAPFVPPKAKPMPKK